MTSGTVLRRDDPDAATVRERSLADPTCTRRRAWSPEALLAVGLLGVYLALLKGHLDAIDGLLMFRQSSSLVVHGSMQLVPRVIWDGSIANSKYGIGQSLLYAPFVAIGHLLGLDHPGPSTAGTLRQYYADPLWTVSVSWINCVVTAATAYCVGRCLRVLGAARWQVVLGVLAFGLGSPALTYSSSGFAQPLTALCFVVTALALFRWTTRDTGNRVLLAVAVLTCVLARPVEGVILGVGALLYLVAGRVRPSNWVWPVVGLALGAAGDLAVNQLRYGSPLRTGYGGEHWEPTITGILGLSVSPGRGIVCFMPFCLFVPWGVARLIRRGRGHEGTWLAAISVVLFLDAAFWDMWWGGVDWGPRLLVPAVPLLAVMGASAIGDHTTRMLGAAAVGVGFLMVLPTVLVDPSARAHAIFRMDQVPLLSAGKWLGHVVPRFATDQHGVDLLWVRLVGQGGPAVLVIPIALLGLAVVCFLLGCRAGCGPRQASRVAPSTALRWASR